MSATNIEKQIDNYLLLLNSSQKETTLSIVKTIAMAQLEYDNIWDDKNFMVKWRTVLHLTKMELVNY